MRRFLLTTSALAVLAVASSGSAQDSGDFAQVQEGLYIARAGDCASCHTREDGEPFAGGRAIETPFGTIFSSNITPDPETGIGGWTVDDLYRSMHEGKNREGDHLYPAMPYPHYTKVFHEDVAALKAYLDTVAPVGYRPPENRLIPPLEIRTTVAGWNLLFFKEGVFQPDPAKSAEWNRGAYLVQGLGHCGSCHTPLNVLGAEEADKALQGAAIQGWTAPSLVAGDIGPGGWSRDELVAYLKTGRNAHATASGPMSETVANSTRYMTKSDLEAMATYLLDLQPRAMQARREASGESLARGERLFADHCTTCHNSDGSGQSRFFADLRSNGVVSSQHLEGLLRVIIQGATGNEVAAHMSNAHMPAFGWKLDDRAVADVATFLRNSFGNVGDPVDPADVKDARERLSAGS